MRRLFAFTILSIALPACDPVPPPAELPAPPPGCGAEAQMFGPCGPGYGCADDDAALACIQPTDSSSICLPLQVPPSATVQACAASLGALACSDQFGLCALVCPGGQDSECGGDMACDNQSRLCVWPGAVPAGGTTGEPPANPTSTSTAATTTE